MLYQVKSVSIDKRITASHVSVAISHLSHKAARFVKPFVQVADQPVALSLEDDSPRIRVLDFY